ncbi:extracellular tyrosine-protein kinase PKDCC-like [Mytilus californianus]|uniref:extracellular tyrosine-protein kinase PKDCC-like n=1 Tax=Mytilus californianus TaxID=6549 RepID=UPI0022463720|nr:extracellular tyrosine-protein kinase PKDCC-like [Mytilus californianus]XP_052065409.1 extracellular tyrosine-protein kinase PKDCC-like [Mytilus californianus]
MNTVVVTQKVLKNVFKTALVFIIFLQTLSMYLHLDFKIYSYAKINYMAGRINRTPGMQKRHSSSMRWDRNQKYRFNCTNMNKIQISEYNRGGGWSKIVDIGTFENQKVVIQRLSPSKKPKISQNRRLVLFMKNLLMRDQLNHPSIIKMLGYCLRHIKGEGHSNSSYYGDLSVVFEYGTELDLNALNLTIGERLNHAADLASLLSYLHNSPLGSLEDFDIKPAHFKMVNGKIKLIDLDFMKNVEPICFLSSSHKNFKPCPFNISCQELNDVEMRYTNCQTVPCEVGVCRGTNVKYNLQKINTIFFQVLLKPTFFPFALNFSLSRLLTQLNKTNIGVDALEKEIRSITLAYTNLSTH